jgi:hypothetical protein
VGAIYNRFTGYGSLICVMKSGVTSCDNRAAFQYGTGLQDSVTQFGFENGTLPSDKQTHKQANKQVS